MEYIYDAQSDVYEIEGIADCFVPISPAVLMTGWLSDPSPASWSSPENTDPGAEEGPGHPRMA